MASYPELCILCAVKPAPAFCADSPAPEGGVRFLGCRQRFGLTRSKNTSFPLIVGREFTEETNYCSLNTINAANVHWLNNPIL